MNFIIRFKIRSRFGKGSKYSLRDLCLCIVDKYSLTNAELARIVTLQPEGVFYQQRS